MRNAWPTVIATLCAFLLISCGAQREFGEGVFVKRKHLKGWHVDLGRRAELKPQARRTTTAATVIEEPSAPGPEELIVADLDVVTEADVPPSSMPASAASPSPPRVVRLTIPLEVSHVRSERVATQRPPAVSSSGKWSAPAIMSFVFFCLTLVSILAQWYGLVILGMLLTLIFSIVGLVHTSKSDAKGRGFAISALVGVLLLGVLLLIASALLGSMFRSGS